MNYVSILITLLAGLSTVLGACFIKRVKNTNISAFALAFATGIMLMISLGELVPEAFEAIGEIKSLVFLAIGVILSLVLDIVLPHHHHHEQEAPGHYIEDCECVHDHEVSYGFIVALVLHNVLEGFATGVTVATDIGLGITMAIGIAIHNIPIGTTIAVSVMSAEKSRTHAIFTATLVGLSQPLGALVGMLVFGQDVNSAIFAACMAIVAGIMVFISFDELWPAARKNGSRNLTIIALVVGICFIPITEMLASLSH